MEHRLFRLHNATTHCLLRLFADATGRAPAFARGAGYGLETLSRVAPSLAPALERLKPQVALLAEARSIDLGDAWCGLMRRWPAGFSPAPPWLGPRAELLSVLDPEICDLELEDCLHPGSVRLLIKRELMTEAEVQDHQRAWHARGLKTSVASANSGPGFILLGSATRQLLDHAVSAESNLARRDATGDAATSFLGQSLGYPDCCIAALVSQHRRDDFHAALCNVPAWPHRRFEPYTAWLNPKLTLLSHFPCSLDCAPSHGRARQLLGMAEQHSPGLHQRWERMVSRIHVLDAAGRYLLIQAEDEGDPGTLRLQNVRIVQAGKATQLPELAELTEYSGELADPLGGGFATRSGSLRAIIAADHRPRLGGEGVGV